MYKVQIIDDEPLACDILQEYLQEWQQIEVLPPCHDGYTGLKAIQENRPDLLLLDVQMPKLNGFEMLDLLDNPPAVIFTTAFDEYAMAAFEANALDYLLKPIAPERFRRAMQKFVDAQSNHTKEPATQPLLATRRLVVRDEGKIRFIPWEQLLHLEADGDYTLFYTRDGKFSKKRSLGSYETILPTDRFVRIHRSHIVNLEAVMRIEPYEKNQHVALLPNNIRIPVSRRGYQVLREVLGV